MKFSPKSNWLLSAYRPERTFHIRLICLAVIFIWTDRPKFLFKLTSPCTFGLEVYKFTSYKGLLRTSNFHKPQKKSKLFTTQKHSTSTHLHRNSHGSSRVLSIITCWLWTRISYCLPSKSPARTHQEIALYTWSYLRVPPRALSSQLFNQ